MLKSILEFMSENYPLTIFIAILLGYLLSRVKIAGFSIGSAGILFVGIFMGILGLTIPDIVRILGLLLFIYAVGIQSGSKVLSIFSRNNTRYIWIFTAIFIGATLIAFVFSKIMGLSRDVYIGIYCGMFGNASALANLLTTSCSSGSTVSFSTAYLTSLILCLVFVNFLIDRYHLENNPHLDGDFEEPVRAKDEEVIRESIIVQKPANGENQEVHTLEDNYGVLITEVIRNGESFLPDHETVLESGDVINTEGYKSNLENFEKDLGKRTNTEHPHLEQAMTRYMVVTNRSLDGKTLKDIQVRKNFDIVITRIWRSGLVIAAPDSMTTLEPGDSLEIYGKKNGLEKFESFAGKRDKSTGELDFLSMSTVIVLGLLLGNISIPTPSGSSLKLGIAGGVLLIALAVGYFRRIGFVYGQMSPQSRATLRELGLTLFLLGVSIQAGNLFKLFSVRAIMEVITAGLAIVLGFLLFVFFLVLYFKGRRRAATIISLFCGAVTNTPALGMVVDKTGHENFMIPFASVYPLSQVLVIIVAQILYSVY